MLDPFTTAVLDQESAARRDAAHVFQHIAAAPNRHARQGPATPWLVGLVAQTHTPGGRRRRCSHVRRSSGPMLRVLAAHTRALQCLECSVTEARRIAGTDEDRTCDVCRALIPEGQVNTFCVLVGTVLVTGGHCAGCTPHIRQAATS